jgi:hypothetical protein
VRNALLGLCVAALGLTFAVGADEFGLGARPWFGWWDSKIAIAAPYTLAIDPRAGGGAARSGLRAGDRMDLRAQTREGRVALLYQPMATQRTPLTIERDGSTRSLSIRGSSVWENATFWKLQPGISRALASIWFTLCVLCVALRRSWSREAAMLALVLLCSVGVSVDPSFLVVPAAKVSLLLLMLSRACGALAALLLVRMSSGFGVRAAWRTGLECVAYAAIAIAFVADGAAAIGVMTMWFDPLPYVLSLSPWRSDWDVIEWLLVAAAALAATATNARSQRAQAGWLLLPLPLAFLTSAVCFTTPVFVRSWFANVAVIAAANAALLLGALLACAGLALRDSPESTGDGALVPDEAGGAAGRELKSVTR